MRRHQRVNASLKIYHCPSQALEVLKRLVMLSLSRGDHQCRNVHMRAARFVVGSCINNVCRSTHNAPHLLRICPSLEESSPTEGIPDGRDKLDSHLSSLAILRDGSILRNGPFHIVPLLRALHNVSRYDLLVLWVLLFVESVFQIFSEICPALNARVGLWCHEHFELYTVDLVGPHVSTWLIVPW
jgi:hypothetical protein